MFSGSRASRFSLDLLDEPEHHLAELQAEWLHVHGKDVPGKLGDAGTPLAGRLHVATSGIFFEPDAASEPVIKVAYVHMRRPVAALTDGGEAVEPTDAAGRTGAMVFQPAVMTHMMPHGRPGPFRDVVVDAPGAAGAAGIPRGSGDLRKALRAKLEDLRETGRGPGWLRPAGAGPKVWWPPAAPLRGRSAVVVRLVHSSAAETLALLARLFSAAHDAEGKPAQADAVEAAAEALAAERWRGDFDKSLLTGFSERVLLAAPMLVRVIEGTGVRLCRLMLTDAALYVQPSPADNPSGAAPPPSFPYGGLTRAWRRRRFMRETGLELVAGSGPSERAVLLEMQSVRERETVVAELERRAPEGVVMGAALPGLAASGAGGRASASASSSAGPESDASLTARLRQVGWLDECLARTVVSRCRQWQEGGISTLDYLSFLNAAAGRSKRDLGQYPVFPWVLADYSSAELDLASHATFRRLDLPVGALREERIKGLRERLAHMPDGEGEGAGFLYGTHYSTPGYVLYFRVRELPEGHIRLQSGRFDKPDRMFLSVAATWEGVTSHGADFKELTPEFYSGDGRFLRNSRGLDLGVLQDGGSVGDVDLPPWCRSPRDFVRRMREALESDHVSRHIHEWVDLIFGSKQRGKAAREADNLFYPLTYEGVVDMDAVSDPQRLRSLRAQISEFGQTPRQIFQRPHPARTGAKLPRNPRALVDEAQREAEALPGKAGAGAAASADSAAVPAAAAAGPPAHDIAGPAGPATAADALRSESPVAPTSPWAEEEEAEDPGEDNCPALGWTPLTLQGPLPELDAAPPLTPPSPGRAGDAPAAPGTPGSRASSGARAHPLALPRGPYTRAHVDGVVAAAVSDDGQSVWTLSADRSLSRTDLGPGPADAGRTSLVTHRVFAALPTCLAALPCTEGGCVVGDAEGGLAVLDGRARVAARRIRGGHSRAVLCAACALSGSGSAVLVATGSADTTVRVRWAAVPAAAGGVVPVGALASALVSAEAGAASFREHGSEVTAVALRPGGGGLVSGDASGCLVWTSLGSGASSSRPLALNDSLRCEAGEALGQGPQRTTGVVGLAWSADGGSGAADRVVVGLATGRVVVASGSGDLLAAVETGEALHCVAFAGGPRWAVSSGSRGAATVWDVARAERLTRERGGGAGKPLRAVAASEALVRRVVAFPPGAKEAGVSNESMERGWAVSRAGQASFGRRSTGRARATAASGDYPDAGSAEQDDELDAVLNELLDDDGEAAEPLAASAPVAAQGEREPWMLDGLDEDQHGAVTAIAVTRDGSSIVCGTRVGAVAAWT